MKYITYISGFGSSEGSGLIIMLYFLTILTGVAVTLYWLVRQFRAYKQRNDPNISRTQRVSSPDLLDVFLSGSFLGSFVSSYRRKKRIEDQSSTINDLSSMPQPAVREFDDPIPSATKFYSRIFIIRLFFIAVLAIISLALVYFTMS